MRGRPVSSWRRAYRLGFALLQTTCQALHPTSRKCPRFCLGCHLCAPNVIGDMYVSKTSGASRLAGKRYLVACSIHISLPGWHRSSAADAVAVIWGIPVGCRHSLLFQYARINCDSTIAPSCSPTTPGSPTRAGAGAESNRRFEHLKLAGSGAAAQTGHQVEAVRKLVPNVVSMANNQCGRSVTRRDCVTAHRFEARAETKHFDILVRSTMSWLVAIFGVTRHLGAICWRQTLPIPNAAEQGGRIYTPYTDRPEVQTD